MNRTKKRIAALLVAAAASVTTLVAHHAEAEFTWPTTLLTGFAAKEACSCAFLAEQSDEYCTEYAQPGMKRMAIGIDHSSKTTSARLLFHRRTAHFEEGIGCQLDH